MSEQNHWTPSGNISPNGNHPKIDELLSGFIDGELTERQCTEVKRLVAHDRTIAKRLQQLEKTKNLLASLPRQHAPTELLGDVKNLLERRMLLNTQTRQDAEKAGARGLLLRRVVAVAAMIGLIAVLGVVIYTIVGPVKVPSKPSALAELQKPKHPISDQPHVVAPQVSPQQDTLYASTPAVMTLKLKTTQPIATNASVFRAIYDNGLLDCSIIDRQTGMTAYQLNCGMESVRLLVADLAAIWDRLDHTSLTVGTKVISQPIIVENVSLRQLTEIINQPDVLSRTRIAGNFATLNRITQSLPAAETLAAIRGREYNSFVVKPVLTSGERETASTPIKPANGQTVSFTIVVLGL